MLHYLYCVNTKWEEHLQVFNRLDAEQPISWFIKPQDNYHEGLDWQVIITVPEFKCYLVAIIVKELLLVVQITCLKLLD